MSAVRMDAARTGANIAGLVPAAADRMYAQGLRAVDRGDDHELELCYEHGPRARLRLSDWSGESTAGDQSLLDACSGPTLDIGCGPGRLAGALAQRGHQVLAVDVVAAAVRAARRRGAAALQASVFDPLPATGRWQTLLLADGNIGIGGDPARLLERCRELLCVGGRVLVEVGGEHGVRQVRVRLESRRRYSEWLAWAHVGRSALPTLAYDCGLAVHRSWVQDDRCFAALVRPSA